MSLMQLSITLGILLAAICNVYLAKLDDGWRASYAGNGIFSIIMTIVMVFMPESPRWLVQNNKLEEAEVVSKTTCSQDVWSLF